MPYQSIYRSDLFRGQVGVVTGGGSGIGRCIAHELASLGATVIVAGRDEAKLAAVKQEIADDGGKADGIRCDIRSEAEVKKLFEELLARHGRCDFVVNNGGGQFVSPADSISLNGWKAVVDTNLTGTFLMCREAYTRWMGDHGGAIVNIVAEMWRGMPMMAHSGAARAGVVNLTQTCALEWANAGVRVNAVAPGLILSSGFKRYPPMVQEALKTIPDELPFGRFGTESEVSAAVVYLLSPAARYVSGETLKVDGASSLYRHPFTLPRPTRPNPSFAGFHRPADVPEGLGGGEE